MDLHKLRIFTAVAKTGSFTKAAEMLYVTQPTASQQLGQLESELGLRLFIRSPRRATLTAGGKALLPYAEQLLDLASQAAESARAAAGVAEFTLRLGAGHTLATYLLPRILGLYREKFKDRKLRVTTGNTSQLLDQIDSGVIEAAIIGTPAVKKGIEVTPIMTDRVVAIFPPESAPAGPNISLAQLLGETLLVREPGSALYAAVEQILGRAALESDSVIQLAETEAIKRTVAAGIGVALIQEMAVREEVESGRLAVRHFEAVDDTRTYGIAYRQRGVLSTAMRDLLNLIEDMPLSGSLSGQKITCHNEPI